MTVDGLCNTCLKTQPMPVDDDETGPLPRCACGGFLCACSDCYGAMARLDEERRHLAATHDWAWALYVREGRKDSPNGAK